MQHSKVRKGVFAVNLNTVLLWKYNYSAAQKAIAQRPRLISALEICASRQSLLFCEVVMKLFTASVLMYYT